MTHSTVEAAVKSETACTGAKVELFNHKKWYIMKIGFFTYGIHGNRMTGIARYAVELTRAMKGIDPLLEITLLNPYPETEHLWYRQFPVYPLPHLKKLPLAATLGNYELHRAARKLDLDIVHDPIGIAPFLVPGCKYKKITTIHDAVPAVYPKTQPLLSRILFSTLIANAGRSCDAILTVSQTSADDLQHYYRLPPEKIHVTPNGVHPPSLVSSDEAQSTLKRFGVRQPYFLYVGALHPRKNIRRVIEAFGIVHRHHPHSKLVIVGPPSWGAQQELQNVIRSSGDDSGIVFTDFLTDQELGSFYQEALALVFPSLYEGFGLPVLEAMSYGTPVITSNVSALPEVAGDAALLVDPLSVDDISASMLRVIENDALRDELRRKGRVRFADFSWLKTAETTLDVYRRLLG